jgi:hypothetical protein
MRGDRLLTARSVLSATLVVLALLGAIAAAGSIPHAHLGAHPGLFNQDHDLSLLSTFASSAPLPVVPAIAVALVVAAVATSVPVRPAWRPTGSCASRAPPRPA